MRVLPSVAPELETIARDVVRGLGAPAKTLPSKYFYDDHGSALFERICELPEYYVTRTEVALLRRRAGEIAARTRATELVELGPGSTRKARFLLEAMRARSSGGALRYVPLDVCGGMVAGSVSLERDLGVTVVPIVGDFLRDLGRVPPPEGRRLVAFLGSTLGNLEDEDALALLRGVRGLLGSGGRFLLGTDLVKPRAILEPAYDDASGVTAEFNRNALRVVSRALEGDARPELFDHVALWNEPLARIEMHLRAREQHVVRFTAIDFEVGFARGETIRTEISRKWTRPTVRALLERAGLRLEGWIVDPRRWFALSLARPA